MQDNTWIFQSTRENCAVLGQIWLRETSSHCWRMGMVSLMLLKADVIVTPKLGYWPHGDTCNVKCVQTTENRRGDFGEVLTLMVLFPAIRNRS